jgi:hypothetical protein
MVDRLKSGGGVNGGRCDNAAMSLAGTLPDSHPGRPLSTISASVGVWVEPPLP